MAINEKYQTRQVKIYRKLRESPNLLMHKKAIKEVPWLNVSGDWLAEMGFKIGTTVIIKVNKNELIIKSL